MNEKKALKKLQKKLLNKKAKKLKNFNPSSFEILTWFDDQQPVDTAKSSPFHKPYKSQACKKCPALTNGLCKCALKKLGKAA